MQKASFICDDCGQRIEDMEYPFVVYQVVGIVPMHPMANPDQEQDVSIFAVPATVRDQLLNVKPRVERCLPCHAWAMGHDLVDADGNVVVSAATVKDRDTFHARATDATATLRAARPVVVIEKPTTGGVVINTLDAMKPQPSGDDAAAAAATTDQSRTS